MRKLEGVRVLLVDDDTDTRDWLCFVLEAAGARIECLPDAREALEAIQHNPPDVLLSDISMPHIDGLALIRMIRALPPERGGCIPAAALTAHASNASRDDALRAGFHAFLVKPIEPENLVDAVLKLTGTNPTPPP